MRRTGVEEVLGVSKTRFFALLKKYRRGPEGFEISYGRRSPSKLTPETEVEIKRELLREKKLIDTPRLPISSYNLSAARQATLPSGIA